MAEVFSAVLGRPVRHEHTPLESIRNPDMNAMWTFLNGPGYQVDLEALHAAHQDIGWQSFAVWAQQAFESPAGGDQ
jgi:hypothetical protein